MSFSNKHPCEWYVLCNAFYICKRFVIYTDYGWAELFIIILSWKNEIVIANSLKQMLIVNNNNNN